MAELSELSLATRLFLRTYPWRRIDPVPCAPLRRPLAESRVALVTTGGLYLPDQEPFDDDIRGGDASYRVIPSDADTSTLAEAHRSESFDHAGIRSDPNLALPLDRLCELGLQLAPRHLSFMGSITAPGRLIKQTAPEAAQLFVDDGVDVALLVPV